MPSASAPTLVTSPWSVCTGVDGCLGIAISDEGGDREALPGREVHSHGRGDGL